MGLFGEWLTRIHVKTGHQGYDDRDGDSMSLAVVGSPFFSLVNRTTDRLVGMWESRVLGEISTSLWKPFGGFHGCGCAEHV